MSNNNSFVQVAITPARQQSGGDEEKAAPSMQEQIAAMQAAMQAMQSQLAAYQQASTRRSIADTLHSVPGERAGGGQYSASAALPPPPVVGAQQRATDARRQSFGVPFVPTPGPAVPHTPAGRPSHVRMASLDEGEEDDNGYRTEGTAAAAAAAAVAQAVPVAAPPAARDDGMPEYDARLERVSKAITSIIKTFHGQAELDKYNVLEWVQMLDTQFSVRMGTRQAGRLSIVRSLLGGAANSWMNRKLTELTELDARGRLSEDIEWDTMKQPFIDAHLGIHTIETFKAQLRALRLGSTKTPTPVELNQQFDHLAGMAYPDRRSDMRDTVLGDEYSHIIANSSRPMHRAVMLNQQPTRVDEWKTAVSRRWTASQQVASVEAQLGGGGGNRGGWQGRGNNAQRTATVASVQLVEVEGVLSGVEGESFTEEGVAEPAQQLSAAGEQKGGRRQGGGGKTRKPMSGEKLKLFNENKCFTCHETGHRSYQCKKKSDAVQQGKGNAE